MTTTKDVKSKEKQKLDEKSLKLFKEKYDQMLDMMNLASVVECALVARKSVEKVKKCRVTILGNGALIAKSYGHRAEEFVEEIDTEDYIFDEYIDCIENIDGHLENNVSLILSEQKRAEALLEDAMINKLKLAIKKNELIQTSEYKKYKLNIIKLNAKAEVATKLKNKVEQTKKLVEIAEEKEDLEDRSPLNSINQQLDFANNQIETALREIELCEKELEDLDNDFHKSLDIHISQASNQTDLVELRDGGLLKSLFKRIASFFTGNKIKQFIEAYQLWIKSEVSDLNKNVGDPIKAYPQKFEIFEQEIDSIEKNNLGRLSGVGRNLAQNIKASINIERKVGRTLSTGVSSIIKASQTINKQNSEKMLDGLVECSKKEKVVKKKATSTENA